MLGFDPWLIAALGWAFVATLWLVLIPKGTKGRGWHYGLAYLPLIPLFLTFILPPSPITVALRLWICGGAGIVGAAALGWVWGTVRANHGLMDVAYAMAPVFGVAVMVAVNGQSLNAYNLCFNGALLLWSARLGVHVYRDNIKSERQPYAYWRKANGRRWIWWSAFQVHLMQAVIIWLWSAPMAFILTAPQPHSNLILVAGLAVWLLGFNLQQVADSQLALFKKNAMARGGLLDTGVWAWVRHPNYLGEILMWFSWFILSLAHPYGALMIWAPAFTLIFIGFVSAAPFKEAHMARTRPELWADYCARTPRLFPWPRPVKSAKNRVA